MQMALTFESPLSQRIPKMDSSLQRPQSALVRGVHITELSDGCMNPSPVEMQESDILMEQYLSPTKLQLLTGADNLEQVHCIELKVDTRETTLNNFGALLPNLTVLKLSGSSIPCIRDLGSSLRNLEVLWMSRCGLEELDGVSSMLKLRELYLAYNELSDISPLSMLEELEILDLEGNNIDDMGQIQYLTLCGKLHHVTLDGNPICVTPSPDAEEVNYDYRKAVKKMLPNLLTLDDKSVAEDDADTPQNVFDADWAYLEELQQDALIIDSIENEKETVSAAGRPTTAALRPATEYRPGSALRPSSGFRPSTASRRPASIGGGRPSSAWTDGSKKRPASSEETNSEEKCEPNESSQSETQGEQEHAADGVEASSDLTCGTVICGNPSKALRERRKASTSQESVSKAEQKSTSSPQPTSSRQVETEDDGGVGEPAEGAEGGSVEDKDLSHLLQELRSWKTEHEKRLEKIRESKAPQVFKIEHEADEGASGEDEDNSPELSDNEDIDFRPSSVMQRYFAQQRDRPADYDGTATSHSLASVLGFEDESALNEFLQQKDIRNGLEKKSAKLEDSYRLKEYEKSLDEDEKLLKEYERVQELSKQQGTTEVRTPREGKLRELRVPSAVSRSGSAGHRPPTPPRAMSPLSPPFGLPGDGSLSPRGEMPFSAQRERPKKIKKKNKSEATESSAEVGPTGLPGSSQQPQIRDIITPPGKPGVPGLRPPSASLQQRIRRQLPEVPPLPSRPPPLPKS